MCSHTFQSFLQVIGRFRRVQVILLGIKQIDIRCHHRLSRALRIYDIFVIPVFHDKSVISFRRKIFLISIIQIRCDHLLQRLATGSYNLLRNPAIDQRLHCRRILRPSIHKLHIQELFHSADRLLPVLSPADPVIA